MHETVRVFHPLSDSQAKRFGYRVVGVAFPMQASESTLSFRSSTGPGVARRHLGHSSSLAGHFRGGVIPQTTNPQRRRPQSATLSSSDTSALGCMTVGLCTHRQSFGNYLCVCWGA